MATRCWSGTPGALVTNKLLIAKLAYDSDAFAPVSVIAESPQVLVVHAKVGADSLQKLIALAKANPDRLNYGSPGSGTVPQLAFELLKATAGIKIVHVPFKGNAPALASVMAGQVEMLIDAVSTTLGGVRAGTLRALALTGAKRHPSLPGVPTVSEVLPGFLAVVWYGMVAPPGTPAAITNRISAAVAEVMKQPDAAKRLLVHECRSGRQYAGGNGAVRAPGKRGVGQYHPQRRHYGGVDGLIVLRSDSRSSDWHHRDFKRSFQSAGSRICFETSQP